MDKPQAFTLSFDGIALALQTNIGVTLGSNLTSEGEKREIKNFVGVWDTGATHTAISQKVIEQCNLQPLSKTKTSTAAGIMECNVYLIDLLLPNSVIIQNVQATSMNMESSVDILVGMNVIANGDFSITNLNGKTKFSFRLPSMESRDFVKEINSNNMINSKFSNGRSFPPNINQKRKSSKKRKK